jgi:hypothetical protein
MLLSCTIGRLAAFLSAGWLLTASVNAQVEAEENIWPFQVTQRDRSGNVLSWQAAGPFIFRKPSTESGTVRGVRPIYAEWRAMSGELREFNVLYPIFTFRTEGDWYRWSVFQLINRSGGRSYRATAASQPKFETFDIWPFWFSRDTGTAESSYHALLPIAGPIKNRFGYDQLDWVLFPFYGRAQKRGAVTYATPWPFIKTTRGTEQGFAIWPIFGSRHKDGAFDRTFYLWPLGWNNTIQPSPEAAPGTAPRREVGFLPFFARESEPGYVNSAFLWPFFGYTDRTLPKLLLAFSRSRLRRRENSKPVWAVLHAF